MTLFIALSKFSIIYFLIFAENFKKSIDSFPDTSGEPSGTYPINFLQYSKLSSKLEFFIKFLHQ